MVEVVFNEYSYKFGRFYTIDGHHKPGIKVFCRYCDGNLFVLIKKGKFECLECRCGNKIFADDFDRKTKMEKYQNLLSSLDEVKDDFLSNIRTENKNSKNERIGVFVDIQNVYYGSKTAFNRRVDYKILLDNIIKNRRLIKATAYVIKSQFSDSTGFVNALEKMGYTIRSKDLRVRGDGSQKGNVDIEMAIDIINEKDKLDSVALVSGDGDFVQLVEFLKERNLDVEVYSFKNNSAYDLRQSATRFFEIDETYLLTEEKTMAFQKTGAPHPIKTVTASEETVDVQKCEMCKVGNAEFFEDGKKVCHECKKLLDEQKSKT
jgi:uncharacterized LabA/DUF88 family protein